MAVGWNDVPTGTRGTLRIYDNGSNGVEFAIACSDPATNVGSLNWSGFIGGTPVGGSINLPAGFGQRTLGTYTVTSTMNVGFSIPATGTQGLGGPSSISITANRTPPAGVPGAPSWNRVENVTTTGFRLYFNRGAANGAAHIDEQAEYYTNPAMTGSPHWINAIGNGSYTDPTANGNLSPGTTYYIRVRSRNSVGWSAWSSTWTQATLPSTPPTIAVTSSASGLSALVLLTPPSGVSGVQSYNVERRIKGQTAVTAFSTTTTSNNITGLTPGTIYEWRAQAVFASGYTSPFSGWFEEQQENPSTNPGDYFDGASADTTDQDFRWTSTANASTSIAVGFVPQGWEIDTVPSGSAVLSRVTAGRFGTFAARMTVLTDATSAGFRVGMNDATSGQMGRADVTALTTYTASIFVNPSRYQRMAAEITWMTSAGALVSRTLGTASLVNSGQWTRLVVSGEAPMTAEWASVRAIDVAGTGWTAWLSGETLLLDGAMMTLGSVPIDYFDGDFPDDANFSYAWTGAANATTSIRENISPNVANDLVDPDCILPPPPPRPPTVPDDCIEEVGIWRRYTYEIQSDQVPDWLDVLPTFRLRTDPQQPSPAPPADVRQVRIRIYPNPFGYASSEIDYTNFCSEQIVSYIPADTVMTLDGELQRAFAEVRGGVMIAADHLLYGTGGTPASWPVLTCGIPYVVTLDVPATGVAPVLHTEISLTRRT